jgi:2Fe-2S ferredoxin
MAHVTCIEPGGREVAVEVPAGWSLMQAARTQGVDGILAECGGACACATCHCYVDEAWLARLPPPSVAESQMLDNVADERLPGSRLSCQLRLGPEHDGLRVTLPARQI